MVTYEKALKLKLNHRYTYQELCNELGEERVNGTTLYNQRKNWSKYFEYHIEGNTTAKRYIITKIYRQVPIRTLYEVEGVLFDTLQEAEEYRKSL